MKATSRRRFFKAAASAAASLASVEAAGATQAGAGKPRFRLACADYLRFTPLATGDLRPTEVDLDWVRGPRAEMLRRALQDPALDGGEASMLQHLLRIDAGDRSLVALPVFPLRNFTARDLYTLKGSPLTPSALGGRRVGIYNWAASGAVWYRHLLRYLGQEPARIQWVVGGVDQPARVESRAPLPPHVKNAPAKKSLTDLLVAREIDALFAPLPPAAYHPAEGPIVRMIPDYRPLEKRYFKDTGCYPPQHVLVLRREVWQRSPEAATGLVATFEACEKRFQEALRLFPYETPWSIAEVEEAHLAMGPDFHAHGLERNRPALTVFCQSAAADGLTTRRVTVEEYFAEFLGRG
jgi:4,5-dihydroxyphthalate decarboxylase